MILRKLIGWPLCHALYYAGHFAYIWLTAIDGAHYLEREPGWVFRSLYWAYQRGMAASVDVNDWARLAVWSKPKAHTVLR